MISSRANTLKKRELVCDSQILILYKLSPLDTNARTEARPTLTLSLKHTAVQQQNVKHKTDCKPKNVLKN